MLYIVAKEESEIVGALNWIKFSSNKLGSTYLLLGLQVNHRQTVQDLDYSDAFKDVNFLKHDGPL